MSKKIRCLYALLGQILYKAKTELDQLLPIAIGFVQTFKALDDMIGDPLAALLGGLAPAIQSRIKTCLPRILVELRQAANLTEVADQDQINTAIRKLLRELKAQTIDQDKVYTTIAALVLQQCYDGKMKFAEAVMQVEAYYEETVKD